MANELKEIADIVKKCKILLLDIEGTTTSISFVKDKLFPYAEEKVQQFLEGQWDDAEVKQAVAALRQLAIEDKEKSVEGVVAIPGEDAKKEEQIEGLVKSVKWQMSIDRKAGPLKQLQGLIWKQGYDNGDIKGHVYDDVSAALEQWKSVEGQKVYIYSSGSVQAQKLLFGQSLAGDLLPHIEGHFDTAVGAKQEPASYTAIVEKIGCKPDEILFLTDILKEAEAARGAGLHAALVSREGNAPLPAQPAPFPVLHSLAQLASNKRKTDAQEELPSKIAKTDNGDDVKSLTDKQSTETKNEETVVTGTSETAEKMEVEEVSAPAETIKEQKADEKKEEPTPAAVETTVEEVTDANVTDIPIADVEPIIDEQVDKTETEETVEKMETDSTEKEESATVPKGEDKVETEVEKEPKEPAPIVEESPPTVITEIEEVTNEKAIGEAEEIIDDIEPVVEEPTSTEDMEVLQSVGEVLEKECDEILSKVQNVTNLDTIPVKPLLTPITEETMETSTLDNDIVDRILDTELDLEMKKCEDAESNAAEETKPTTEPKSEIVQEKEPVPEEVSNAESAKIPEEKAPETNEESKEKITDKEVPNVSKTETKDESKKEETKAETNTTEVEKTTAPVDETAEQKLPEISPENDKNVPVESKDNIIAEEVKTETETMEAQLNGKTNGESEAVSLNGDVSKDEELSSRLSAENGKEEEVNGSNGDAVATENVEEEKKVEGDVSDIKVKTVPTEEPRTDPIEQPTEA
ncbi:PREDICTED: enolase-phosphatase E1 [Papilio polytes]|uniref:enolase-phosphatase E1 n=1 Tax=Papilio polytes TaxID=76194 RepID=UPI000675CFF7|nr:PREDICTED: enolase-phosphatase E1 [Papilio polytes]